MADEWKEVPHRCKTFQLGDLPELIHVIKTGYKDTYIVVYEDGYELRTGKTSINTKKEIEKIYKIKL